VSLARIYEKYSLLLDSVPSRPHQKENEMSQGILVIEINYNFKSDRVPPSLTQIRKHLDALKRHEYEYLKITDHECDEKEEGDY